MRALKLSIVAAVALALVPQPAAGQGLLSVTPKVGAYLQGEQAYPAGDGGDVLQRPGETSIAFGGDVGVGIPLSPFDVRGSVMVAPNAEVTNTSVQDDSPTYGTTVVGLAADVVFKPLSFLPFVDPYLLAGGGYTSTSYDNGIESQSDFALHAGVGTDVTLGGVRLQVEGTDYITNIGGEGDTLHNVFGTVGLGFSIF